MTPQRRENNESSPAFESASAMLWAMMRRELELRQMGKATGDVLDYMRATPHQEANDPQGTLIGIKLQHRVTGYRSRHNAVTGERLSWYVDFLANADAAGVSPEQALLVAEAVAEPPEDAERVTAAYETQGGRTFFRARWRHVIDGLPVEGDYIEVLVNGQVGRAFSWARIWREPNFGQEFAER